MISSEYHKPLGSSFSRQPQGLPVSPPTKEAQVLPPGPRVEGAGLGHGSRFTHGILPVSTGRSGTNYMEHSTAATSRDC